MATRSDLIRLSLHAGPAVRGSDVRSFDGAWWPESRLLSDELRELFALWPPAMGRIVRVLYSPPDWDDRPRSVPVADRRVKTGCFPLDDTRQLTLSMLDGRRLAISVIPPDTPDDLAAKLLADAGDPVGEEEHPDSSPRARAEWGAEHPVWDNEGGHP